MKPTHLVTITLAAALAVAAAQTPPPPGSAPSQRPLSPMKWRLVILDYAQTLSLLQALKDGGKSGTQDARELEEHARDLQRDYPRLGTPEKFQGLVPAQGPG